MPYTPQTWADLPATTSPISAARLNYMEAGIEDAQAAAEAAPTAASVSPAFVALTDGATVTWATAGARVSHATLTLAGNRTLDITGAVNGAQGVLVVTQDGTGSRTLALPAGSKAAGGAFTLTTTAGGIDVLAWIYNGTTYFWTISKAFA
jgi:hypothetical protein